MIIDLNKFTREERPYWDELERLLERLERGADFQLDYEGARRLHYLYQRAVASLARLGTFGSEPGLHTWLESLVARAYGEIHATKKSGVRWRPWRWFSDSFPQAFRRHVWAFWVALGVTLIGSLFGGVVILAQPESKAVLLPFAHLHGDPSDRVAEEESQDAEDLKGGGYTSFSTMLMTHNTRVSMTAMALGMTYGLGTMLVLFYNGIILGAVCSDYLAAGEGVFLAGWLLPHGVVEIPAILIGGQAGIVLGAALLGRGSRETLARRMRAVSGDLVTLIGGVACFLIWAGIVEAFLSQFHEPVLPYAAKITFGLVELALLIWFLGWWGRGATEHATRKGGG